MYTTTCALYNNVDLNFLFHVCVEIFLLVVIVWLLFRKSYEIDLTHALSAKEMDELIAEWQQEPLIPPFDCASPLLDRPYSEGKLGKRVRVDGKDYVNFATMDFLGLATESSIEVGKRVGLTKGSRLSFVFHYKDVAIEALHRFGTGTCGPRAFYGTMDIHLTLEEKLANFMGCEEAIVYSYGFATIASALPAYCKKGDVIFVDKAVSFAVQKGLQASRSRIEFFDHNDTNDLRRLLNLQAEKDRRNPKKAKVTRRFVVVEGVYLYTGSICPLPELVKLKWEHKVRLFIDESVSFGVLGNTGRGVTEHYGIDVSEIDMICCSLELAAAGTGGFCCGRTFIIDHQRLSGAGYCFSASLPAPLTAALIRSVEMVIQEPARIARLRANSFYLHKALNDLKNYRVDGAPGSPLFHIRLRLNNNEKTLDQLIYKAMHCGIALTRMSQLKEQEMFTIEDSVKLSVSSEHTKEEIDQLLGVLKNFEAELCEKNCATKC